MSEKQAMGFLGLLKRSKKTEKEVPKRVVKKPDRYSPYYLRDFIGQSQITEDLLIHINRCLDDDLVLGHVGFFGAPGLGKTTLARIVSHNLGTMFEEITGKMMSNKKSVENVLFNLTEGDVLFIDEVHSLRRDILEILYSPLQDFKYGSIDIAPFTMVAATTHMGKLPKPLRDRLVHTYEFVLYETEEVANILEKYGLKKEPALFIAARSKGVPRAAVHFLEKCRGYQNTFNESSLEVAHCELMFESIGIDELGLNQRDRLVLYYMYKQAAIDTTRAIGQNAIAKTLDFPEEDYVHMIEPYLLTIGFIERTPKGRIITTEGVKYIKSKM